jgi:hypothetical protein
MPEIRMSSFFTTFLIQSLLQFSYVLRKVTSCSTFCLTKVPTESCGLHLPPLIDEVYETGKKYIIREESEAKVHLFSVGKNNMTTATKDLLRDTREQRWGQ